MFLFHGIPYCYIAGHKFWHNSILFRMAARGEFRPRKAYQCLQCSAPNCRADVPSPWEHNIELPQVEGGGARVPLSGRPARVRGRMGQNPLLCSSLSGVYCVCTMAHKGSQRYNIRISGSYCICYLDGEGDFSECPRSAVSCVIGQPAAVPTSAAGPSLVALHPLLGLCLLGWRWSPRRRRPRRSPAAQDDGDGGDAVASGGQVAGHCRGNARGQPACDGGGGSVHQQPVAAGQDEVQGPAWWG